MNEKELIVQKTQREKYYFIYDNTNFSEYMIVQSVNRLLMPPIDNEVISFKGSYFSRLKSKKINKNRIVIKFVVVSDMLQVVKRKLAAHLFKNEPKPLILSDELNMQYYAMLDGDIEIEEESNVFRCSLTFICLDPFAYSTEEKTAQQLNRTLIFNSENTAPTYPVFEFIASSELKMIGFSHPSGKVFQLGYETGPIILHQNDRVRISLSDSKVYVNDVRKFDVFNIASQSFYIAKGRTEIAIGVNNGARVPNVTAKFREAFL